MRTLRHGICALFVVMLSVAAAAQQAVTAADISRLDAMVTDVDRQIRAVERTDSSLAAQSGRSLADLRDEIAYLRVKLRREGSVTRAEYTDVRDRLETLRVKAQGSPNSVPGNTAVVSMGPERMLTLPVGTEMDVRLQTPLSSSTVRAEQRFEATTVLDLEMGRDVAIPAGSVVRGFVSSVRQAGRIDRTGSLTLSFDELVVGQRISRLRASVVKALDPKTTDDMTRIGAGAVVGAVLGGILGGGKGALLGVLIGGGGTIASTEGSDVDLPPSAPFSGFASISRSTSGSAGVSSARRRPTPNGGVSRRAPFAKFRGAARLRPRGRRRLPWRG